MWKKLLGLSRLTLKNITQGNCKTGGENTSMVQEGIQATESYCAVQDQEERKGIMGVSQSSAVRQGIKTKRRAEDSESQRRELSDQREKGTECEAESWFPASLLVRLTDCSGHSSRNGSFL